MTVHKCQSHGCQFAVTGVSPHHCCKVCHLTPGHHGPFCKKHVYQLEVAKERVEHKQEELIERQRREQAELARKQAAELAMVEAQKAAIDARIEHASHHPHHHHHHPHHPHHHHHPHPVPVPVPIQPAKCLGCHFVITGVNPTHCCNACHGNPGTHGPMCQQQPAKCFSHNCHYTLTGVNPTHCCNKCATHPGEHGPACKHETKRGIVVPIHDAHILNGAWRNASGHDVTMIHMVGHQFTCTNPHQSWSPSVGTLSGHTLTFQTGGLAQAHLVGTLQGDAQRINFSNGCAWVRH